MEKKMPPEQTKQAPEKKPEAQPSPAQQTPVPVHQPHSTRIITAPPSFTKLPPNDLYRKLLPAGLFLLTFVSVMTILLLYMDTTALRAQQFRMNMTRDYELTSIAQDNPALIAYIRQLHLGGKYFHRHVDKDMTLAQGDNIPNDERSRLIAELSENKRNGTFMELLIRGGRDPVTLWLQQGRLWSGLVVRADPEDALMLRSVSPPNVNTLHACLSPTRHPKEVTYSESLREWNEDGVSVNSLESGLDSRGFNSRVMCFPLFTLMLVVNETRCDYVVISSPGDQLAVLETVPWNRVDIKILEIRTPKGPSRLATTEFLQTKGYKLISQFDDAVIYVRSKQTTM